MSGRGKKERWYKFETSPSCVLSTRSTSKSEAVEHISRGEVLGTHPRAHEGGPTWNLAMEEAREMILNEWKYLGTRELASYER
jgi:hypothetical protein